MRSGRVFAGATLAGPDSRGEGRARRRPGARSRSIRRAGAVGRRRARGRHERARSRPPPPFAISEASTTASPISCRPRARSQPSAASPSGIQATAALCANRAATAPGESSIASWGLVCEAPAATATNVARAALAISAARQSPLAAVRVRPGRARSARAAALTTAAPARSSRSARARPRPAWRGRWCR